MHSDIFYFFYHFFLNCRLPPTKWISWPYGLEPEFWKPVIDSISQKSGNSANNEILSKEEILKLGKRVEKDNFFFAYLTFNCQDALKTLISMNKHVYKSL